MQIDARQVVAVDVLVRKTRRLPIPGDVLVAQGEKVEEATRIAFAEVPGYPVPVNVASRLDVEADKIERFLLKREGDQVAAGELIARKKMLLGLTEEAVHSPIDGTVESISLHNGIVTLRTLPVPVEATAYIPGTVVEVLQREGVVVETRAAVVEGFFGVGGERHGELLSLVSSPDEVPQPEQLKAEMQGKILLCGSLISGEFLRKAVRIGVTGLVAGGIDDEVLADFLGYQIAQPITGQENLSLTLIVTEGFGRIPLKQTTYDLLSSLVGRTASINGTTHIRATKRWPEIVVAHRADESQVASERQSLDKGTLVRIVCEPYYGQRGHIVELPAERQLLPSGLTALVAVVRLARGEEVAIPLMNLELE